MKIYEGKCDIVHHYCDEFFGFIIVANSAEEAKSMAISEIKSHHDTDNLFLWEKETFAEIGIYTGGEDSPFILTSDRIHN